MAAAAVVAAAMTAAEANIAVVVIAAAMRRLLRQQRRQLPAGHRRVYGFGGGPFSQHAVAPAVLRPRDAAGRVRDRG
jgi:hypothetical protein